MLDLLQGIRVISFNHFLLGPMAIQALADLGADVVAVETPDGAWQRHWSSGDIWHDGQGMLHMCTNRNKRSLALDLKAPKGKRDRAQAHRRRRRGGGKLSSGRDGQAGLRLRGVAPPQTFADLRFGVGLRPRRPLRGARRPGSAGAGAVRADGNHRPARDWSAAGRRLRGRPPRRGVVRHGNSRRVAAPGAHRQRLPRRCEPDAGRARPTGGIAHRLAQRCKAARERERAPSSRGLVLPCALRHLCDARRPHRHLALPVAEARGSHRGSASRRLLRQGCLGAAGRDRRDHRRAAQDQDDRGVEPSHGAGANLARARAGI